MKTNASLSKKTIRPSSPAPSPRSPARAAGPARDPARPDRGLAYEPGGLREALVAEGRKMFEENGASELSLRALARRLNVSEAAPSKHFKGKEELLAAIASAGFYELAAQRKRLSAHVLEPLPKAREMMLSYVRFAQKHAGLFDLMIGTRVIPEFRTGEFGVSGELSYQFFAASIFHLARESGWPKRSLQGFAHAAWAMEHGLAALILARRIPREDSGMDLQGIIEFSIDHFLSSIVAGPPRPKTRRV